MLIALINSFVILPLVIFGLLVSQQLPPYEVLNKPKIIENKGIYLTAYTAGSKQRRAELVDLIKKTELNSVVIDIKDYSGLIFMETNIPLVKEIESEDIRIPDLKDWLAELKKEGIYTIARITVFQDPYLAGKKPEIALKSKNGGLWLDFQGLVLG